MQTAGSGSVAVEARGSERSDTSVRHSSRVGALDGVRACAAVGVLVFHCASGEGFLSNLPGSMAVVVSLAETFGNFCVAVFFMLSGYLLFREFVRKLLFDQARTRLPHYFERRFLRIYPAYWVATIGWILVIGAPRVAGDAFGILTLTERQLVPRPLFLGLSVTWTLYVEVAFYVFVPLFSGLVWLGCRKRSTNIRLAVVLGSLLGLVVVAHLWIGFVSASAPLDFRLRMNLPPFLGWFALGMALCVASVWRGAGRRLPGALVQMANRPWFCLSISALAWVTIAIIETDFFARGVVRGESTTEFQARIFLQGIAAFFALLPFVLGDRPSRLRSVIGHPRLAWVGVVSFGVYLWHPIIIQMVAESLPMQTEFVGFLLLVAIVLPASIVAGWVSFRVIEKPALSLAR